MVISGKVWKFEHNIDTDIIIPARYLVLPIEEMKYKAMAPIDPAFAGKVGRGDVIVAGSNFGCGSSREQAPAVLKALGIRAIVAISFARIFYRNAINLGMPLLECAGAYAQIGEGDTIQINPATGEICIPERGVTLSGTPLPDFLLAVVADGGLIAHLSYRDKGSEGLRFRGAKVQRNKAARVDRSWYSYFNFSSIC